MWLAVDRAASNVCSTVGGGLNHGRMASLFGLREPFGVRGWPSVRRRSGRREGSMKARTVPGRAEVAR